MNFDKYNKLIELWEKYGMYIKLDVKYPSSDNQRWVCAVNLCKGKGDWVHDVMDLINMYYNALTDNAKGNIQPLKSFC